MNKYITNENQKPINNKGLKVVMDSYYPNDNFDYH